MGGKYLSFGKSSDKEERKEDQKLNVTNINELYDLGLLRTLVLKTKKQREKRYKFVAFGPTKGGKSTFLRLITNMKGCFLSAVERETSHFWRFKESKLPSEMGKSFKF